MFQTYSDHEVVDANFYCDKAVHKDISVIFKLVYKAKRNHDKV